jgi:pimeloyl-ACP methyl ester carboxylesterase
MRHVKVNGVEVAYEVVGRGEPMLFIHGAHIADAMRPLVEDRALDRFQRIRHHRRGVGGSSCPPEARATAVAVHAEDAVALLEHLGVDRAHVVGHSSGGSIALEIASRHPTRVASLVLLEPALMMVPNGAAFVDLVTPLVTRYEAGDAESAVHGFLALVGDRDWRNEIERTVPGAIAQAVKDAATFFVSELPAVSDWTFGPEQASAITCPVLSVLGSKTSPLFVEGHDLLHDWFPQCHDADIPDASHLLQMEAPGPVAAAIAAFCSDARQAVPPR